MQQPRRALGAGLLLHDGPQLAQVGDVGREFLVGGVLGLGAHDVAAFLFGGHQALDAVAQLVALGLGFDALRDADVRVVRQVDQHAAGHADLRGQAGALGADRILDDLHHQGLAFEQQFLDGRGGVAAVGAFLAAFADVGDVQEGGAAQADVDEGALHARQHARDAAEVDVADVALLRGALDVEFLDGSLLDDGDPGFVGGYVDEDVFGHGMCRWRARLRLSAAYRESGAGGAGIRAGRCRPVPAAVPSRTAAGPSRR